MIKLCFILLTQTSMFNPNAAKTVLINAREIVKYENSVVYLKGQEDNITVKENGTEIKAILDKECK